MRFVSFVKTDDFTHACYSCLFPDHGLIVFVFNATGLHIYIYIYIIPLSPYYKVHQTALLAFPDDHVQPYPSLLHMYEPIRHLWCMHIYRCGSYIMLRASLQANPPSKPVLRRNCSAEGTLENHYIHYKLKSVQAAPPQGCPCVPK